MVFSISSTESPSESNDRFSACRGSNSVPRTPQRAGKMFRCDLALLATDGHPLDGVMEFPDISRPAITLQQRKRVGPDTAKPFAPLSPGRVEKRIENRFDVFRTFPQGRDSELIDVEPIIEIQPKALFFDEIREFLVGRRNDSDIDLGAPYASQRFDNMVLEDTQQLGLSREAHLSDFIQKQGPAVRQLKPPRLALLGIGECAFFISEQFRLQEIFRNAGAVQRDERSLGARTGEMDGARQQILSGSALAGHEDGGIALGDLQRETFDQVHLFRHADNTIESELLLKTCPEYPIVLRESTHLQRSADDDLEFIVVHRFGDVVIGPLVHGFHGGLHRSISGDNQHRDLRHMLFRCLEHVHAGYIPELKIGHDEIERRLILDQTEGIGSGIGEDELVAGRLEHKLKKAPHPFFIFNDQEGWSVHIGVTRSAPTPQAIP